MRLGVKLLSLFNKLVLFHMAQELRQQKRCREQPPPSQLPALPPASDAAKSIRQASNPLPSHSIGVSISVDGFEKPDGRAGGAVVRCSLRSFLCRRAAVL